MKKSEKIEIRISPDDKEALAKRAEAEGRPASEVVRDLLQSGGVTAQAETVPEGRRRSLAVVAGLLAVGAALAVPVTLLAATDANDPLLDVRFVIEIAPDREANGTYRHEHRRAEIVLPASRLGQAEALLATGADEGYRMAITLPTSKTGSADNALLRFPVCYQSGDQCDLLAEPVVTWTGTGSVEASGVTAEGHRVYLHVSQVEPKAG